MQQQLLFKLDQGPHGGGLRCDTGGLFLGSQPLLLRDADGNFEARDESNLRQAFSEIYRNETDWESRIRSVKLVAGALNKGEIARAMMTAVLMRLPEPDGPIRISDVDGTLAKAGFNPDELRDERGRWTTGGETEIVEHDSARYPVGVQLADAGAHPRNGRHIDERHQTKGVKIVLLRQPPCHPASDGQLTMQHKPYVPQDIGELLAYLSHVMLASPTFKDESGYLRWENIDTTFFSLNEGLLVIRKKLGEERYAALRAMSDKMRALFEADPEDMTGDTHAGCMLIHEMEDILMSTAKRKSSK